MPVERWAALYIRQKELNINKHEYMAETFLRQLTELREFSIKNGNSPWEVFPSDRDTGDRNTGHCLDSLLAVLMTQNDEILFIHAFQVIAPIQAVSLTKYKEPLPWKRYSDIGSTINEGLPK